MIENADEAVTRFPLDDGYPKMSRRIKIKVRPDEIVRFPGACVNCNQPAREGLTLQRRDGRTIRQIDVPLCDQCAAILHRESAEEERLRKVCWLVVGVTGVLVFLIFWFLLPITLGFWPQVILALLGTVLVAAIVWRVFQGALYKAALPEKKAVREAAKIDSFSWRTATFVFTNESFVEGFIELNEPLLVEN